MADLIITLALKVAGVATPADATPLLRDAAGAYGVRRGDTLAVVVAAGTPMIAGTGVGAYQFTLAGAVAGVTYDYVIEAVVAGRTIRYPGQRTIAATGAMPTYLDVASARIYAGQLHGLQATLDATDANLLRALASASARVDAAHRWQGARADAAQPLEFPRVDGDALIVRDPSTGLPAVPMSVKVATLHEANSLLVGRRAAMLAAQHDGLASQSTGDASESYVAPVNGRGLPLLCKDADTLVGLYRLRSGRLT